MKIRRFLSCVVMTVLATGSAVALAQPAGALVPDAFGFALYSGGVVSQAQPVGTTVVAGPPGRWTVTFPGVGFPGGVVHVTAVHDGLASPPGRWCQADGWAPVAGNEVVKVSCYSPGGALSPLPGFSVQFAASSGLAPGVGRYGYLHANPGCGLLAGYSSVLGGINCAQVGIGSYSIGFPGLSSPGPIDGGWQITAVNSAAGARCKLAAAWTSSVNGQFARILCYNSAGALANNGFTASYQYRRSLYGPVAPPNRFGYFFNGPPAGPASTSFNQLGGVNTMPIIGPPGWQVNFPLIYATPPSNTQVTTVGTNANYCGLHQPWFPSGTTVITRITCFSPGGAPAPSGFLVSHNNRS
jgi:hypothetical protein